MSTPKVVYFNIEDTLEYENSLLEEWGVAGQIELIEKKTGTNDPDAFIEAVDGADGVVIEYFEYTAEIMDSTPDMKIVALQSIGTNAVDKPAATAHGIAVTNSPGFCVEEVATTAVGMVIDLARKITFYDRSVRAGHWDPILGPIPHRISGKTIGLVFFGGIPQAMVPALTALGLRVVAWAPTKSVEFLAQYGVEKAETLEELLAQSDFVSLHTPLLPETTHLIGEKELAVMKPDAFLINTARGSVVDEPALVAALTEGVIAGAAIDVIEDEDTEQTELRTLENVVINPHAAFLSEESFYEAREISLRNLVDRLVEKKRPRNLVNKDLIVE